MLEGELPLAYTSAKQRIEARGKPVQRGRSMPEPNKKGPFRVEEDWFAFVVGILIALAVFLGWIKNVPW